MSNAANYDEGDSRTELVERLGALVADADAYSYAELAGAPILARVEAALLAASDAISRVLLADGGGRIELLRAALETLAQAEQAASEARVAINAANGGQTRA